MDAHAGTRPRERALDSWEEPGLPEVCDCMTLATYLHVDLKTVQGLAQRREVPCRKVLASREVV